MIHKQKNSLRAIEEFLDSDDEFPDNYYESAEVPVYLDDNRFERIEFSWIQNHKLLKNESNSIKAESTNIVEVEPKKSVEQKKFNNRSIVKGSLNKCDILCLKSVEKTVPNDILLWFAKFLLFKDMQSHFLMPKSCLVSEPVSIKIGKQEKTMKKIDNSSRDNFTYRVIISKECN